MTATQRDDNDGQNPTFQQKQWLTNKGMTMTTTTQRQQCHDDDHLATMTRQ